MGGDRTYAGGGEVLGVSAERARFAAHMLVLFGSDIFCAALRRLYLPSPRDVSMQSLWLERWHTLSFVKLARER